MRQEPIAEPWYRQPLWLGLVGFALMVAGWKLGQAGPLSPKDQRQAAQFDELRGMAEDGDLRDRLDDVALSARRDRPYQLPGRLLFVFGVGMFGLAGVLMARAPARPAEPAEAGPD